GRESERKFRLFAVGCCRRIWHLIRDYPGQHAVEVAELFADGKVSAREKRKVGEAVLFVLGFGDAEPVEPVPQDSVCLSCATYADEAWDDMDAATIAVLAATNTPPDCLLAALASVRASEQASGATARDIEGGAQCSLLRCIFGNPFRRVTINPSWLT